MLDSVLQTIAEYNMIACGDRVLCAVSGGADSVGMLCALHLLYEKLGFSICACHLNHGLRAEESDRDEAFVRALCEDLNVPLYCEKIKIDGESAVEERARDERYKFFDRAKAHFSANKIATAHNAEDNLETVIFHLARGTALKGLCGIPPVRGDIIRPLIFTSREEILRFLNERKQSWVEDSSNASDKYTRNLIRHKIMPVMRKLNKDAVKNSARAIKLISKDEQELSKAAREISMCFIGENFLPIELCELGDAYLSRIIIEKCEEFVKNQKQVLDFSDICDIIALMRQEKTTGTVIISKDLRVHRAQNKIYFSRGAQKISEAQLSKGESICVSGYKITCNDGEITVRARRDGDKIKLKGRRTRLLKKILCDAKIPEFLRDSIPVIEKEGKIIAVCGFGFADGEDSGGATIEVNA